MRCGQRVFAKFIWRLRQGNFSKRKTYSSSVFCFAKSTFSRRRRRIYPLSNANKYIPRNFLRSSAGGRLPPLRYTHYFAQTNIFPVILCFGGGTSKAPSPTRKIPLLEGFLGSFFQKRNKHSPAFFKRVPKKECCGKPPLSAFFGNLLTFQQDCVIVDRHLLNVQQLVCLFYVES